MRTRSTGAVVGLALCVSTAAVLVGCVPPPEVEATVTVAGEPGAVPDLVYDPPFAVEEPSVEVLVAGDGPEVVEGEPVLVHYYAESAEDGSVVGETFSSVPKAFMMSKDSLGEDIYAALTGKTVGSRILHMVPEGDQPAPTIAVFDILPTRAAGERIEPRDGLPVVELAADGAPAVTIPEEAEPPEELVTQALIRGRGQQVEAGQMITVQYVGLTWSDGEVFDSTWDEGELPWPFPIGVGSVISAWDTELVEQTVGSQVLLVVPPGFGYGGADRDLTEETQVFVVDILAAGGGPSS